MVIQKTSPELVAHLCTSHWWMISTAWVNRSWFYQLNLADSKQSYLAMTWSLQVQEVADLMYWCRLRWPWLQRKTLPALLSLLFCGLIHRSRILTEETCFGSSTTWISGETEFGLRVSIYELRNVSSLRAGWLWSKLRFNSCSGFSLLLFYDWQPFCFDRVVNWPGGHLVPRVHVHCLGILLPLNLRFLLWFPRGSSLLCSLITSRYRRVTRFCIQ